MRADDIVIGTGVTSSGNFTSAGTICVDGVLKPANVQAATLSISFSGEFHGEATVRYLEVFGALDGNVVASEQVVLRASAVVMGTIASPYIVMHRGATVCGEVKTLERPPETRPAVLPGQCAPARVGLLGRATASLRKVLRLGRSAT